MTIIKSHMFTNKKLFGIILLATAGYTSLFFLLLPSPISTTGVLLFIPVATLAWLYGLRIGIFFTIFLLLWQVLILLLLGDRALTTILMSDDFLTAVFISFLLAILIGYIHDLRSQLQVQQQDSKKRVSEQTPLNLPLEEDSLLQFNRLQFAIEESGDGIWDWDIATGDVYFSPQWKTLLGLDDTQMANPLQIWEASIHPEDLPFVQSEMKAYLVGQSDVLMIAYRIKTQESNYIWVLARGKALRDESGKAVRMIGTHSNITKRKRNEDAIYNIAKGVSAATGAQFFQ